MIEQGFNEPIPLVCLQRISFENFDCGVISLNMWLRERSRANDSLRASRTYVVVTANLSQVAGFYCISNHALMHIETNAALRRNMPNPIPVILLGRLAVDKRYQNCGLGSALLRHALERTRQVAEIVGCRGMVTEPINEAARRFYAHHGFISIRNGSSMMIYRL